MFKAEELDLLLAVLDVLEGSEASLSIALTKTEWGSKAAINSLSGKDKIIQAVREQIALIKKGRRILTDIKSKLYRVQDAVLAKKTSSEIQKLIEEIEGGR